VIECRRNPLREERESDSESYPSCRRRLTLLLLPALLVGAQAEEGADAEETFPLYALGDQTLSPSLGLFIPLFFQSFDGTIRSTNLVLGGWALCSGAASWTTGGWWVPR